MYFYRLFLILVALFLAGCSQQEISQLKQDNTQLKEDNRLLRRQVNQLQQTSQEAQAKVDQDYAKRMAEFDQAMDQAGVVNGCRALFNLCPASITAPGDTAKAAGYGGGTTLVFWAIYLTKITFMVAILGFGLALWTRRLRPDLTAQRLANIELDQTKTALRENEFAISKINEDRQKIEEEIQATELILVGLRYEIYEKKDALAALDTSMKNKKSDMDALSAFKF